MSAVMTPNSFSLPKSLQSLHGSILGAVFIHGLIYLSVILIMGASLKKQEQPMDDSEIGYEILNEAAAPTEHVAKVVRMKEPVVPVETQKTEATARELQDEKSDVTGTSQAAAIRPSTIGSESGGDANATPFYKIKPKYPKPALIAGSEGWVLMKIDVNEAGIVENVRIIGGEKRNLFQDEARRAVEQWKYRPFLGADGKPLRKVDHQVRVDFKLSANG